MKQYKADKIMNIALAGHSGAGKTTLAEAALFAAGATDRLGKVSDGNTVMDFDQEEIKRKVSVLTSVAPVEWSGSKINFIDTPGLFDFEGSVFEGMRAADIAVIVVSAKNGISVGTEKAVKAANARKLAKVFVINGLPDESVNYYSIIDSLKELFGASVCPVMVPFVEGGKADTYINVIENKAYKYSGAKGTECPMPAFDRLEEYVEAIKENIAETSDELMEKYFGGEDFNAEEISQGVRAGIRDGVLCPVFCLDAVKLSAVDAFLNSLVAFAPTAADIAIETAKTESGDAVELKISESESAAAVIFKTVADPFVGKLSYFKVFSGKISPETPLVNMRTGSSERISKVMTVRGKKQEDAPFIGAGDIGAIPKLTSAVTGDTLCAPNKKVILDAVSYPAPSFSMAIYPKKKGEEDKVAQGLGRLMEEDPTIRFKSDPETKEMVVSGMGDQHLDIVVSKLKSKFNVEVTLQVPRVAYREAIRKKVQVQGRHKKQSGGAGQFGDVWIEFEPCDCDGLEFGERVVGGSVPRNFYPAVEKGLREAINKGPLAGYPVVGLRATLYDGSYHPVDSNEMAFKMAAKIAYKNGMAVANPTLLEPIGSLKAYVPDGNTGDIMGEVNKRRGRILGMAPGEDKMQVVEAEVPMAEMHDFATFIRQTTQGRGYFSFEFARYEDAPGNVAQKVIEKAKLLEDE